METSPDRPTPVRPELRGGLSSDASAYGLIDWRELGALLDAAPERPLRAVPGRTTFLWPHSERPRGVAKRFRGDLLRDAAFDRLRGRRRSPARREFENLLALDRAGFPVPTPVGWVARGRDSALLMGRVAYSETLQDRVAHASTSERQRLGRRLARLVAQLHEAGWYHRDLYLQHFLLPEDDPNLPLVLIDLGRARRQRRPRRRWFEKDLAALLHSTPALLGRAERLRVLAAYLDARGVADRAARRGWARAVEARRARIAAHRPRYS